MSFFLETQSKFFLNVKKSFFRSHSSQKNQVGDLDITINGRRASVAQRALIVRDKINYDLFA